MGRGVYLLKNKMEPEESNAADKCEKHSVYNLSMTVFSY